MATTIAQSTTKTEMMSSTDISSAPTVQSVLNFYAPPDDGSAPYNVVATQERNYRQDARIVGIHDLRGYETLPVLDKNGFTFDLSAPPFTYGDFFAKDGTEKTEFIKKEYYPRVQEAVKRLTGGSKVVIFDHTARLPNSARTPVGRVHIDQSLRAAVERVKLHGGDDPDLVNLYVSAQKRFQIVNYWKPLAKITRDPLAVADARTINPASLVSVQHRYPNRTGETVGMKYDGGQEWYFLSGMDVTEAMLIKCADNKRDVPAKQIPHSAFALPGQTGPGRVSIEVRTLVFFD
ncbi:hypothetical protein POJ06DRAFT_13562 [Lipomyces tetrasporus]|uniref:Methyltransferase n=1 Tax=Lipomyces tetrasporus TaxID=54092 RepID=A0AAD7VVD4_9ASCO|nr:uncharacterized protein POJ06DRAFT_13562 [Lipomyces tetrasporus]KAJ8104137.1 hypothetical protein POJ06DRAFT_13562 [Lipomyces tetrasporus]